MGICKKCGRSEDLYEESGLCEICEAERRCEQVDKTLKDYDGSVPL